MDYQVRLDGGEWISVTGASNHTFRNLVEGLHTVTVRATDDDSNQVEDSRAIYVRQVVRMTDSCLPGQGDGRSEMRICGKATDAATGGSTVASVSYSVDGGAAVAITVTPAVTWIAESAGAYCAAFSRPCASAVAVRRGSSRIGTSGSTEMSRR